MTSKTNASTKPKATKKTPDSTERLRKAAIAEIRARIDGHEGKSSASTNSAPGEVEAVDAAASANIPSAISANDQINGSMDQPSKGKKTSNKGIEKAKADKPKRLSGLDAAAEVLAAARAPMNCKDLWAAIDAGKLWKTGGKTPHATLYSAIIREIAAKGSQSRFKKTERGLFTLSSSV